MSIARLNRLAQIALKKEKSARAFSTLVKKSSNKISVPASKRENLRPSNKPFHFISASHTVLNKPVLNEFVKKYQKVWLDKITKETKSHCQHLANTDLAERVNYFKVNPFIYQNSDTVPDISRFNHKMDLPKVVSEFDPHEKNTLFIHPGSKKNNQTQEIKRALDIRLYPSLRNLIRKNGAKVFLGSKVELQSYTDSINEKLIAEIEIPSSAKFYVSLNSLGDIKVYLSNLVSHENLIQQLITLKLAGIDLHKIPILGNTQQFKSVCQKDILEFEKQCVDYLVKRNVLIIAGCTLENLACSSLEQIVAGNMIKRKFSGEILSLTYMKSENAANLGFIVLNLNYGEICEDQITMILEKFNCIGIFSGSAAGYIPSNNARLPNIGERINVYSARHHFGELISLDKKNENLHLHVPTIFVETFNWLKNAKSLGASTVDVETFYILKAIQKFQSTNSQKKLHIDIGVFISDYVGKKPLRSYDKVFSQYPLILQNFVSKVLVANITLPYNNNHSSTPIFSKQYFSITPKSIPIEPSIRKEPVIETINTTWNKSEFKRVHTPVTIGRIDDQNTFSNQKVPRCLHLPIQLPGSDIRIPNEYQHFTNILQRIFDFEISINPNWKNSYAYLSVDQGFVARANSQRVPGPHVDGIPRDRDNPEKQLIDHAYLATDEVPPMFYIQQFDMTPYDPKIHHFFAIFRALSDESRTITVKPYDIVLMNAYSVHTPTQTQKDVNRTFMRLEISPKLEFDRKNNSINPHFLDKKFPNYPFNYVPRPIPSHLFVPPDVYLKRPISNRDYSHESIEQFGRANLLAIFNENERVKQKDSLYKNLNLISDEIMKNDTHGIVLCYQGIPHAFSLYTFEKNQIKLNTLFTLKEAFCQEMMIYGMKILKEVADRLSLQAGLKENGISITLVINENNQALSDDFLRAARLAKIEVIIENSISPKFSY